MKRTISLLTCVLVAAACGGSGPESSPSGKALTATELKLRVLDALPAPFDYCDPDVYPIGHGTTLSNAREHLKAMRKDRDVFRAILAHEHISPGKHLTDRELVLVYTDYKQIAAVELQPDDDGFRFSLPVVNNESGYDDQVEGLVTRDGRVQITDRIAGDGSGHYFNPNCPICLARGVLIATPTGPVAVQDVRVGMAVWSTDRSGERIRAIVQQVGRTAVPSWHEVVRLELADGRVVLVSPGHPSPNGRLVGALRAGDRMDGTRVVSVDRVSYSGGFTYDLLPSGPTHTYFAGGVLLGSTLASR